MLKKNPSALCGGQNKNWAVMMIWLQLVGKEVQSNRTQVSDIKTEPSEVQDLSETLYNGTK